MMVMIGLALAPLREDESEVRFKTWANFEVQPHHSAGYFILKMLETKSKHSELFLNSSFSVQFNFFANIEAAGAAFAVAVAVERSAFLEFPRFWSEH